MIKVTFCVNGSRDVSDVRTTWFRQLVSRLHEHGIEATSITLPFESLRYTQDQVAWILDRLREDPPDVFVPNEVLAGYFAARWVRAAGIPTVGVIHSGDDFFRSIVEEFVSGPEPFRLSAAVFFSEQLETDIGAKGNTVTLIRRIPYGVRIPDESVTRAPGLFRIAYAGQLAEKQKRISDVALGFCRVLSEVPGVEATIYGDGPDRPAVNRIVSNEGRGLNIRWGGAPVGDDLRVQLLHTDAIVLLSDYEDSPIELIEGMACGVVPICLRVNGIDSVVNDGVDGMLIDDRRDALVDAIRSLSGDLQLWTRLSRNARKTVEGNFSEAVSATAWATFLENLASTNSTRRTIPVPRHIALPTANPAFAAIDSRYSHTSIAIRVLRRTRMIGGMVKRRILGVPSTTPETAVARPENIKLSKAVIITVSGGLANQMMCYKGGRYLADLKHATLILDATRYEGKESTNRTYQLSHYDLRHDLTVHSGRTLDHLRAGNAIEYVDKAALPDQWGLEAESYIERLKGHEIVWGDFWLANFLRDRADEYAGRTGMLADLVLDPQRSLDIRNVGFLGLIRESPNPVAIHVRRGDFATDGGNLLISEKYYNSSIQDLEGRLYSPAFFVFSDDIPWCRENLAARAPIHFVDVNDEREAYRDMYLASQCRHFILSNESTFSHQAVQLSTASPDRIIITSTWDDLIRSQTARG